MWESIAAADFLRHEGHWTVRESGARYFEPFGAEENGTPWRSFQAWRADLDALLLRRARQAGVSVRQPCRARRPLVRKGRVAGVGTTDGPVAARFVLDAAGGRHWLARHLNLPVERHSSRLIARYGYVKDQGPDDAPTLRMKPCGWTWTARVRPDLYAWTQLRFSSQETGGIPEPMPDRERRVDVTWRIASPTAGPGFFLIGDAAAVLDPASSHGVLKAMMSGMLAAHYIVQVIQNGAEEEMAAQAYHDWLRRWFLHDTAMLRQRYPARFTDQERGQPVFFGAQNRGRPGTSTTSE